MRKTDIIWVVGFVLFWVSFLVAFLVDYLGLIEANNSGFLETIWISWILWTVGLGFALAIITHFAIKD